LPDTNEQLILRDRHAIGAVPQLPFWRTA